MLLASVSTADRIPLWATITLASVPVLAAFGAAIIAARSARHARMAQAETERLRRLEERVAQRKYEVYKPMIELLGSLLDPRSERASEQEMRAAMTAFSQWVGVFGSDEAVASFRNFMQGTFHAAPVPVLLRLYVDFQVAVRRDMGDPDTQVTPVELLGMRLNDLHTGERRIYDAMCLPLAEVCQKAGWAIPWQQEPLAEHEQEQEAQRVGG